MLRSGREYENATTESDKLSPRILGYFLFRSPYRRQSSDLKRYACINLGLFPLLFLNNLQKIYLLSISHWSSTSFKDLSPHIASVKNILETHASHLMSGKELSKLVAFVKGTQFDLVVRFSVFYLLMFYIYTFEYLKIQYTQLTPGISSARKTGECSLGEFCFRASTDWAEGFGSQTYIVHLEKPLNQVSLICHFFYNATLYFDCQTQRRKVHIDMLTGFIFL